MKTHLKTTKERIEALFNQAYGFAKSLHRSDLTYDIAQLWEALTLDRANALSTYFRSPALRRAYLGYYLPLYSAKIALLMEQMIREGHLTPSKIQPLRVLDLGSGPLAGLWGAHLALGPIAQAMAVDKEIGPMRMGHDFFKQVLGPSEVPPIQLVRANLTGPEYFWKPGFKPNLIVMGHVLNELGNGSRFLESKLRLVLSAAQLLENDGRLLIVEPASKVSSRALMEVRDALFQEKSVHILAPCTGASVCPLLKSPQNWCHGELSWERPKVCEEVDRRIGFDKSFLKYSYLLIAKKPVEARGEPGRIVSGEMRDRGIERRYVCTPEGLLTLSQKESDQAILSRLSRGEKVDLSSFPKKVVKIEKET